MAQASPQNAEDASRVGGTTGIVKMSDVIFSWPGPHAFSMAINDFVLPASERVLLTGPSGVGKSTFLSLLCGIVAPASGHLEILGTDTAKLSNAARDHFRAEHFGIIFQMFNLLPYGSIIDNVLLPLSFAAKRRERACQNGSIEEEAWRLLASLGLEIDNLHGMSTASLSVGQQQRVAAARALIGRPEIIVADEPTSSLDRDRQEAFLDLLFSEAAAAGACVIMVSHEEALGSHFDRVVRLEDVAVTTRSAAV